MGCIDLEQFGGHTPGPWKYDQNTLYSNKGIQPHIAYTCEGETGYPLTDRAEVNGRLLAAAPTILAELKALRKWRETMLDARGGSFIDDAYNTAETELHDATT